MIAALWTSQPPPSEYVEMVLCRDVFHCTPSMLRAENAEDIMTALACIEAEGYVRQQREKARPRRR